MKTMLILTAFVFCGILCASPYGRALQQARKVSDQKKRYAEPVRKRPPAARGDDFAKIWSQMGQVIRQNRGVLPAPAGVAGLRRICGPGKVSPALLKINDFRKLSERNCAWAYVGGALGTLRALPQAGEFPILFSKPRKGLRQLKVLMANGQVKTIDSRRITSCSGVVNVLRRSSRNAKNPVWKNLSIAASQIDRAGK